jgi:uncharacterized membrane protein YedE/YeeE
MITEVPWTALFGGVLLGLSAALLLLVNGRIAGISGILSGLLQPKKSDTSWRVLFLIGMISAGMLAPFFGFSLPQTLPQTSTIWIAVAGLLVGIGTKLANGCTSGHGICGMGRLSSRSIIATIIFMAAAFFTVYLRFHV